MSYFHSLFSVKIFTIVQLQTNTFTVLKMSFSELYCVDLAHNLFSLAIDYFMTDEVIKQGHGKF